MLVLLISLGIFVVVSAVELPTYIPKCYLNNPDLNDCILQAGNSIKEYVRNGINEIGVPALNHFKYPQVNITHTSAISRLDGTADNLMFDGLYNYELTNIDFDPNGGILKGSFILPSWSFLTDYYLQGSLVQIPINGSGKGVANFKRTNCEFTVTSSTSGCDNLKLELVMKIEDLDLHLAGLVNEDKTNSLFNGVSDLIAAELSPVFEKVIEAVSQYYLQQSCKTVPFSVILPASP